MYGYTEKVHLLTPGQYPTHYCSVPYGKIMGRLRGHQVHFFLCTHIYVFLSDCSLVQSTVQKYQNLLTM